MQSKRLLAPTAEKLIAIAGIRQGEAVLEVGSGAPAAATRGSLCTLEQIDVEYLDFPDETFDVVIWDLGAVPPDVVARLREFGRVTRWNGRVALSIPGRTNMQPLRAMYLTRLQSYGIAGPDGIGRRRFDEPEQCRDTLREAGFERIEVRAEQFGCYLSDPSEWWDIVQGTGLGSLHADLAQRALGRFKAEHLAEVATLATNAGIWLDLAVIFAVGWKQI